MKNVIAELGFVTRAVDGVQHGEAHMAPELRVPGTDALRMSVLLTWADILTGFAAMPPMMPQVPLTLDLELLLHRQATSGRDIVGVSNMVKAGRRVVLADCRFFEKGDEEPFAVGWGSFMPAPGAVFPDAFVPELVERRHLEEPLGERLQRRHVAPGVVELPRRDDGLNAIGAIQGGLLTVAAEDAALSLAEPGAVLSSMSVRYLRPFTTGPASAVAERIGDVVVVQVSDAGQGKLGAVITARLAPA